MIIKCDKCNKKFVLDDNLIPNSGRMLKCGTCGHTWFFKQKIEELINENNNDDFNLIDKVSSLSKKTEADISKNKVKNKNEKIYHSINKKKNNDILKNTFKNLIIILITFIGIIMIVDTFKIYLSNFLPGIIPLLDNLYSTLYDLKLFIKDLFN